MAINMYLKFEDPAGTHAAKGSSKDANHTEWVEILSWSHSFTQPTSPLRSTAGAGTVERANHSNFNFTKYMDASTDDLLKHCWSGRHFAKAMVEAFRAEETPVKYLEIEMQDVVVSNVSFSGGGGDIPIENIALSYSYIKYVYTQQAEAGEAGGNQPISHDLTTNTVS